LLLVGWLSLIWSIHPLHAMCGVFDVSAYIESGYEKPLKLGGEEPKPH